MNKAIVLAAGEGTRMKSQKPKVLHELLGRTMLDYVYDETRKAGMDAIYVITGHKAEEVEAHGERHWQEGIHQWIRQPMGEGEPYGTGFAAMQALDRIKGEDLVLIVCGDTPLLRGESLKEMMAAFEKDQVEAMVMVTMLSDPSGYGRILRDEAGGFLAIKEDKDCSPVEREIKEINGGVYCFRGDALRYGLERISDDNAQKEYYLTDVLGILKKRGRSVGTWEIPDAHELDGINSRVQLAASTRLLKKRINEYWMAEGVTMIDPEAIIIESTVRLEPDVTLWPGVILQGSTQVASGAELMGTTRVVNSHIGKDVTVDSSLIESSQVGAGTKIGPFAHLRPGAQLGERVKIGNFVEVKNSYMGDDAKASHLAYVGDAVLGKRVNVSCGVIFANYDGENKYQSIVEDDGFIGSNVNIVSPVHVGKQAFLAAGSTITKDVEADSLAIERSEQISIANWSKKRAEKAKKMEEE